jgi:GNAT superfamily N-acetyltransferase
MDLMTPAGRQLNWYLEVMNSDLSRLQVEEVNRHLAIPTDATDDELRSAWAGWASRVGRTSVANVERDDDFEVVVVVETDKNTRYRLTIGVELEEPHRMIAMDWQRLYDFEVVVRAATDDDGSALAEIERRAPLEFGGSRVTFDRGADYLAAARLMEDATVVMAEVDGVPAGVEWAALHRTRIGGRDYRLVNFIHLRVAAEHQRKGIWSALVRKLNEAYPPQVAADGDYGCAARDNTSVQTAFASRPRWRVGPIRALIRARPRHASPVGRTATPNDAERIVELLNSSHGHEEMFLPYTRDSLCARLERAPDLYSWQRVRLTDHAVVGVWPSGPQIRIVRETDGHAVESRHGLVLDYGYAPGAEQEFEQLLQFWGDWLAAHDHTHLSIFTSEPSPSYPIIAQRAEKLEPFDLWTSPVSEPDAALAHGVYADQVYF